MNPTLWNANPTATTINVVEYDGSITATTYSEPSILYSGSNQTYSGTSSGGRTYDSATQPYDGYAAGVNPYNWKNATEWTPITGGNSF